MRIIVCEPDPEIRASLRSLIESDPMLSVVAEPRTWQDCEKRLQDLVPELVIARAEMIPKGRYQKHSHTALPLIIDLRDEARPEICLPLSDPQDMPPDPESIKRLLDRAVRNVYECKVNELRWLMDRYVTGLQLKSDFVSALKVKRDGRIIDLNVESITSVVAARKYVTINSTAGCYQLREPMGVVAKKLDPARFMRIHRSIVVNIRHLDRPQSIATHAVLENGARYPVGINYRKIFGGLLQSGL